MSFAKSLLGCLILGLSTMSCMAQPATGQPDQSPASSCPYAGWLKIKPAGSGSFASEWKPGSWPMGLKPVLLGDRLWMIGQTQSWSSSDGQNWEPHTKPDWGERIRVAEASFAGQLWTFGGQILDHPGQPAIAHPSDEIWHSRDGMAWHKAKAAWSPRMGPGVAVFKDKLWLLGGATGLNPDKTPKDFLDDLWRSQNGLDWERVSADTPWPARDTPRLLSFADKLWLIGGQGQNDIWVSENGTDWKQVMAAAPWTARYDYGVQAFAGRIYVFGGRASDPRQAYNDVWSSADGSDWRRETEAAPWTPRSGIHSTVFQDKLWIYSGKHTGSPVNWAGDIWLLAPETRCHHPLDSAS